MSDQGIRGRDPHRAAITLGIIGLLTAIPVAAVLGPVVGLLGYVLVLSSVAGTTLAVVGRTKTPPRYGRAAFALTCIPVVVIAVMLTLLMLMILALGGGNPNS